MDDEQPEQVDLGEVTAWLADNAWAALGLTWVLCIVALTELTKRVFDLLLGAEHKKRRAVLQLAPFVFGVVTGPLLAPAIADTTSFAWIGPLQGALAGLVAGLSAIGAYDLARETRPLRMLKVLIRGMFSLIYETVTRRQLSEADAEQLEQTQKRPPVDP